MPIELTIVVAIKDWDDRALRRLLSSADTLKRAPSTELVVVYCGSRPPEVPALLVSKLAAVLLVRDAGSGVYQAFEQGVAQARGRYCLFMGGDDVLLPGLDVVLDSLLGATGGPDLVVCSVLFGEETVLSPIKTRWGLVFRNWCQQGVLYQKQLFETRRFEKAYRIQADHEFNIRLAGDDALRIVFRPEIVAAFSRGGMSSTMPDLAFWRDMPGIVRRELGPFLGCVSWARRTAGLITKGRPEARFRR
jgi:hypothetical protein